MDDFTVVPTHLLTYSFENKKAKQLVSLFIIHPTDKQMQRFNNGKLWTIRQIIENMNTHLFSEYFIQEFPYLQNTVLLAESFVQDMDSEKENTLPPS